METVAVEWCDQLLATLTSRVGASGLAAASLDPGLRAELARHESEVRDWMGGQGLAVSRQSVSGYAAVLLAAAQRCGRLLPPDPQADDWADPEWYLVRLVALCAMAAAVSDAAPNDAAELG
jgi:hypothetical protein